MNWIPQTNTKAGGIMEEEGKGDMLEKHKFSKPVSHPS
jgi:hypothetical protein